MPETLEHSFKKLVGKLLLTLTRPLSVFDANIVLKRYFRLRREILLEMPWTTSNLCPLVLPFISGDRVPGNGNIAAILQMSGLNIIVFREAQGGESHSFSITSPCCPKRFFPFGVTEVAVLELEGASQQKVKRYDTLSAIDGALQEHSTAFRRRLSCELFPETRAKIESLLGQETVMG